MGFSFTYSTHVHWSWSEVASHVGCRARENFHSNKRGCREHPCIYLLEAVYEFFQQNGLLVLHCHRENNTPNPPLVPPKPYPPTSPSLAVRQDHVTNPSQWNGSREVVWYFWLKTLKSWFGSLLCPFRFTSDHRVIVQDGVASVRLGPRVIMGLRDPTHLLGSHCVEEQLRC